MIIKTLMGRNLKGMLRNPLLIQAKIIQGIFIAIFQGGVFWDAGSLDFRVPSNFRYISGFFFFIAVAHLMSVVLPIALEFPV